MKPAAPVYLLAGSANLPPRNCRGQSQLLAWSICILACFSIEVSLQAASNRGLVISSPPRWARKSLSEINLSARLISLRDFLAHRGGLENLSAKSISQRDPLPRLRD